MGIDHFKKVNDTFGHNTGDLVLKKMVKTIQDNIRESDVLIRWGGEEFILLMEVPNQKILLKRVDQLRGRIENTHFPEAESVTGSFGITSYRDSEFRRSFAESMSKADKALYQVKNSGRNGVIYAR